MSVETNHETRVRWTGSFDPNASGAYTRDMLIEPAGKPVIAGSASASYGGDDGRYNPEDLMLASLAECHLLTYLAIAAKARIPILGLEVSASGIVSMVSGKMRFREATIVPSTRVAKAEDIQRATDLHQSAHRHCFMSNSVNFPIALTPHVFV
jgi:organic hydroperoxide reductase OsmC/OhrA